MSAYTKKNIELVAVAMRRARDVIEKPFYLLTGAGCSKSAGIPLASELVAEIHEKYSYECKQILPKEKLLEYGACMSCLSHNERRELLSPHLETAKINWAHIAIACMMNAGFISRVLTFNFDSILAKACGLVGLYPATYDFAAAASDVTNHIASPAIIHLHGQGFAHRLLNADSETAENAKNLRPLFRHTFSSGPLLVIGYSGQSDLLFPTIRNQYHGEERLFWAGYDEEPSKAIAELLLNGGNSARYFGKADADKFLIELARELQCFPPLLFNDPHDHLLQELENVVDFPLQEQDNPDLLLRIRSQLKRLSDEKNQHGNHNLESLLMEGNWQEVIKTGDPKDLNEAPFLAWAHAMEAENLSEKAAKNKDELLYEQAIKHYQKAIELNPDMHEAYSNWGVILGTLALIKNDESLLIQSIKKFKKAIEIKPDKHGAYDNWGISLGKLAKLKEDDSMYEQAFEKFKKAIGIEPDDYKAYSNWGHAISDFAAGKNKSSLYEQAIEKVKKAIEINADYYDAYKNLASFLLSLWRLTSNSELLTEAQAVLEISEKLHPEDTYNFACLFAVLGNYEECRAKLFNCKKHKTLPSEQHMLADPDLRSVQKLSWFKELTEE